MMDIFSMLMMLFIGIFGGFISGLVGIGGAIIIYPAILVLPILFGFPVYTPYVASGLTSVQVFFSTLSGTLRVWNKPAFSLILIIYILLMMLFIGIFGGFISGLVGIGGAIIIYPAILVLPILFGFPGYTPYVASGLTSVQVFFSTLSGTLRVWKKPAFSPKLIIYMGGGMFVGSSLGALIANVIDERMINIVYVVIAILALLLMFVKVNVQSKGTEFKVVSIVSIG